MAFLYKTCISASSELYVANYSDKNLLNVLGQLLNMLNQTTFCNKIKKFVADFER